jgi:hypothetical protein
MLKWLYNIFIGNGCMHDWDLWKRCTIDGSNNGRKEYSGQYRTCKKCGEIQTKVIK